ncbi:hypothetical protein [Methanosarcina sp. Kolksee]|uniref:hypothetical protein n=1 Tax=Methanosarcina sp. Kolksee TaxID=1434099 RepID=UPI000B2F4BF6|nr:hypothetical protein [Methanosarcina sp. Kolksee]
MTLRNDLINVTVPEIAKTPAPSKSSSNEDNTTEKVNNQWQILIRSEVDGQQHRKAI